MVLGNTPTTSADSLDDEVALEDEDESEGSIGSNLSVLGTLVDPSQPHQLEVRTAACRPAARSRRAPRRRTGATPGSGRTT